MSPKNLSSDVSSTERQDSEDTSQLEEQIETRKQSKARYEHDLQLKEGERNRAKQELRKISDAIDQDERRIKNNEQLISRAPSIEDAIEKRKAMEKKIEEAEKEVGFVEQKQREFQNKYYIEQTDRSTKETQLSNKRFLMAQLDQERDKNTYQAAGAEIRMIESELARTEPAFRRMEEDIRRFDARLYDLQVQLKQLKHQLRQAEQDETVSRRLEGTVAENRRLSAELVQKRRDMQKLEEDLKNLDKTVTKLGDRVKREDIDLTQDTSRLNRAKTKSRKS